MALLNLEYIFFDQSSEFVVLAFCYVPEFTDFFVGKSRWAVSALITITVAWWTRTKLRCRITIATITNSIGHF